MANQSIFNAFERMWQHIVAKLGTKADIEDVANLYVWEKYGENPLYSEILETNVAITSLTPNGIITYASEFEIIDGDILLINSNQITVTSYTDEQLNLIKDKYIKYGNLVYFIPHDATFSSKSISMYLAGIGVNKAIKITVKEEFDTALCYVSSKSLSAYPTKGMHTDGYWYEYYGQLGDAAIVDGVGDNSVRYNIATDNDVLEFVIDMMYVNPVSNGDNIIYTNNSGDIYTL